GDRPRLGLAALPAPPERRPGAPPGRPGRVGGNPPPRGTLGPRQRGGVPAGRPPCPLRQLGRDLTPLGRGDGRRGPPLRGTADHLIGPVRRRAARPLGEV